MGGKGHGWLTAVLPVWQIRMLSWLIFSYAIYACVSVRKLQQEVATVEGIVLKTPTDNKIDHYTPPPLFVNGLKVGLLGCIINGEDNSSSERIVGKTKINKTLVLD